MLGGEGRVSWNDVRHSTLVTRIKLAISIEERRACILDFSPIRESYEELSEIVWLGERKIMCQNIATKPMNYHAASCRALEERDENYSKGVTPECFYRGSSFGSACGEPRRTTA
jgi:hypothetical protein